MTKPECAAAFPEACVSVFQGVRANRLVGYWKVSMKLRVAHCIETVGLGGVEQTRLVLARELDANRFDQILICTRTTGALADQFEAEGVPVHRIGRFHSILDRRPYQAALEKIREFRPHIVHGAVYEGVSVATVCGRLARVPIVIGEETSEAVGRSWKGHLLFRGLMGLTSHAVAVSPAVESYLVDGIKLPRRSVTLINNGVAPPTQIDESETKRLRATLGIRDGEIVIGIVGRLFDLAKRHTDLLHAFRILYERRTDLRLLIVGEGPDRTMLETLTASLGIADRVIFTGYQADTRPFYTVMDIFALSSAQESFGLVLIEAMYAKLPIVATRVGGIPTVVAENQTGLLVSPGNPPELADSLLTLIDDQNLRQRLGEQGFERAHEKFSSRRYACDIAELYERLAARSGKLAR
jgi:glycosyltransferase involved in cell wall biosynthesis